MKPYQPDHGQLLINTNWGSAVQAAGLHKWKGRWVTLEEKKRLKAESHVYAGIRVLGVLALFAGFLRLVSAAYAPSTAESIFDVVYGIATAGAAIQLLRYRAWARYWVLAFLLCTDGFGLLSGSTPLLREPVNLLIALLIASYLFNGYAKMIFGPPSSAGPVLTEHAA